MNKRAFILFVSILIIAAGGFVLFRIYKGAKPAISKPPQDIADFFDSDGVVIPGKNNTDFPLHVADNIEISLYAKNVPGARVLALGPDGELWVSQTKQGIVSRIDPVTKEANAIFRDLKNPHGLVFHPSHSNELYIAEEHRITKALISSEAPLEMVVSLPQGGRHTTRTLHFRNELLMVSIGSKCDVCEEPSKNHGTIQIVDMEVKSLQSFASGLRNSVFLATHPVDGSIWATEMGRDNLGDNLPPDEVNIIVPGKDYGWPFFYGKNIRDQKFEKDKEILSEVIPSHIDLPAHVAPLGIEFIPESTVWPESWWYDAVIAFHGSWNSSSPVGYKLVRVPLDEQGKFTADGGPNRGGMNEENPVFVDIVSGFLTNDNRALGRPVDVMIQPGGSMFVSDDHAGVIYKLQYLKSTIPLSEINTFEECQQAGFLVISNKPATCYIQSHPKDRVFINLKDLPGTLHPEVQLLGPVSGQKVSSPVSVSGKARGYWFFEGSAPMQLLNPQGEVISEQLFGARAEWMTTEFIPALGFLSFSVNSKQPGIVLLRNHNASGLPENAESLAIPVTLVPAPKQVSVEKPSEKDGCVVSGCSGEVCSDTEVVSACLYKEEFACYKQTLCSKNAEGVCTWQETPELSACLEKNKVQ